MSTFQLKNNDKNLIKNLNSRKTLSWNSIVKLFVTFNLMITGKCFETFLGWYLTACII